jgi:SAM-dependent methyltransferase
MDGGSVSFDQAADFYDETRTTDPGTLEHILGLLEATVAASGLVLEIGVGTGQLAVPLRGRGIRVVGVDLSAAMMARLRAKPRGSAVPLVRGDATCLPFADASFGGAYARWILHLIPNWMDAVLEADRVVAADGAIAMEPGGETGVFAEIHQRFVEAAGELARYPGMAPIDRDVELDRAMSEVGRSPTEIVQLMYDRGVTLGDHFDRIVAKEFSWTWRVPSEVLVRAAAEVRAWAVERWDLDEAQPAVATTWRLYEKVP